MNLNDEELGKIKKRCELATAGNWKAYKEGRDHDSGSDFIMTGIDSVEGRGEDIEIIAQNVHDLDFIAHARQDIPLLLKEIELLRNLVNINSKE